jgi:hypothetical protein
MIVSQTSHFRVLSPRNCDAEWCTDGWFPLRFLGPQTRDSGHFRYPRSEMVLRTGVYQGTNWPTVVGKLLSLLNPLAIPNVRRISLRGNPG